MKSRLGILLLVLFLSILNGCADLKPGKTYVAPSKVLSVVIPDFPKPLVYATAKDPDSGSVQFRDDLWQVYQVDYVRITPANQEAFAQSQLDQTLPDFFQQRVLPTLRSTSPAAQATYSQIKIANGEKQFFTIVEMPRGSMVVHSANGGPLERADDVRGVLIFPRDGWCLTVWYSGGPFATPPVRTDEVIADYYKAVTTFANGIKILKPEPTK